MSFIDTLIELIEASISDILIAAAVFFLGLLLGKLIGTLLHRTLRKIELNTVLAEGFAIRYNVEGIIATLASLIIYAYAILFALSILGLNRIVLTIIGGIVIIIFTLSILFSIRDLLPNIIAGVEIQRKGFYKEGDTITVDDEKARVIDAGLLETILENEQGERIIVPSSLMLKKEIRITTTNE